MTRKHLRKHRLQILLFLALLVAGPLRAEQDSPELKPPPAGRKLKVLPASDSSGFNLAAPLQNALGVLFDELAWFKVLLSSYNLPGFTENEIKKAFEVLGADDLAFVYLEKERLAVFLFDSDHPSSFIVDSQSLVLPAGSQFTSAWIEDRLRLAFKHVALNYRRGQYQPLPGSSVDNDRLAADETEDSHARSEQAHRLFRELAALQEKSLFVGVGVGVARISTPPDPSNPLLPGTTNVIDFGAYAGLRVNESLRVEAGVDVYSQLAMGLSGVYRFPIKQNYVSLWGGLGFERIFQTVAANTQPSQNLPLGQIAFGPRLEFHIPLLGTEVRGDLRFYFGGGSLLIGSYGFSCYL